MIRTWRAVSTMLAVALLALSLVSLGSPATAGEVDWCASDPIFSVNGQTFRLTGYWPSENQAQVTGVTYVVTVPTDATVSVSIPAGETTSATVIWNRTDGAFADHVIKSTVTVNATGSFLTKAEVDHQGADRAVYGQSNSSMHVTLAVQN